MEWLKSQGEIDRAFTQLDDQPKAAQGEYFAAEKLLALRQKWNALKSIDAEAGAAKAFQVRQSVLLTTDSNMQNANLVDETNAAAASPRDQGDALVRTVGRFKGVSNASRIRLRWPHRKRW